MSLPRLLLAAFETVPGPTEGARRVLAWLRALEGRFDCVVITVKDSELAHVERLHGARVLRVPVGTGPAAARHEAFDRAVRRQAASDTWDILHFLDPVSGRALCNLKPQHGAALVYEPAGLPSRDLPATDPAWAQDRRGRIRLRRWEITCLARADAVLAPTPSLGDCALALGVDPERVHLLPEPAVLYEERPSPAAETLRIIFPGTVRPYDGLETLLDALGRLSPRGGTSVCLVGPAPGAEATAREWAAARGLAGRLSAFPAWPAPAPGTADVAAFPLAPSEYNTGAGRLVPGIAEALGRGQPLLVADLPLLRGLVPETAGLFHRAGDARAVSSALARLCKDAALRAQLGRGAREAARARHDPGGASQRLLACYARLLAGA